MPPVADSEHVHDVSCLDEPCASLSAGEERRPHRRSPATLAGGAVIASLLAIGAWGLSGSDSDAIDTPIGPAFPAPDFTGLTDLEVARASQVTGVSVSGEPDPASGDVEIDATDVVRYQLPAPGMPVPTTGLTVRLFYGPPKNP